MGGFNKYQEKPWVQLMCKVLILHETNKSQENHINKTWGNFSDNRVLRETFLNMSKISMKTENTQIDYFQEKPCVKSI